MLTVVTGPPCVGKTTHVRDRARPGDIVIDYDQLAVALGSPDSHEHPSAVAYVTKAARRSAIRAAIGCHHRGARVWIIDTDPTPHRRHHYRQAGADVVTLVADRDELHRRASADGRPAEWHTSIDRWFADRGDATGEHATRPAAGLRPW